MFIAIDSNFQITNKGLSYFMILRQMNHFQVVFVKFYILFIL